MIENCGGSCACKHLQHFIKPSEIEPLHRHTLETETDSCSVRVISSAIRHQQTNMLSLLILACNETGRGEDEECEHNMVKQSEGKSKVNTFY